MGKDTKDYYGTHESGNLEWSQSQMAFHFSRPGDRDAPGWDVVISNIPVDTSSAFIGFLNHNWRERRDLTASEIRKMYDAWALTQEGGLGNG